MSGDTTTLHDHLLLAGYDVESYSGRGMYGAECISVQLDNTTELLEMGMRLSEVGADLDDIRGVRVDSMGQGLVVYWPRHKFK